MILLLFIFYAPEAYSQAGDTLSRSADSTALRQAAKKKIYSGPRKASLLSTFLPGAGQAYNKKYWKIPIIYAGLGGFGYMFAANNQRYNSYRNDVRAFYDKDSSTVNSRPGFSGEQLQLEKLRFRKYRDFAVIGLAIVYLINIVDANVDAHLKTFDITDDLSLSVDPWEQVHQTAPGYRLTAGISFKINFKH